MGVAVIGCTVIPKSATARTISFDGTEQNAGLIAFTTNGSGILTPSAAIRYNRLVLQYGTNFNPTVYPGDGLTLTSSNTFLIDPEHLVKFGTMSFWRRNNLR